ncbi:MAG: HEAT repeat domain-containing protein [Planctomycetota bacterium]
MRVPGLLLVLLLSALPCSAEEEAVSALRILALEDSDRGVRYAAVEALGKARAGLDQVVAALEDREWCVRQAGGRALARFGPDAIPAIEEVLRRDSVVARVEAVEALRRIGKPGSSLLVKALEDPDPRVVREALDGLWILGRENVEGDPLPRLQPLLDSDDAETRLMAAHAIVAVAPERKESVRSTLDDLRATEADKTRRKEWTLRLLDSIDSKEPEEPPPPKIENLGAGEFVRARVLDGLRRAGKNMREREEEIRSFLERTQPLDVQRDAAIAMELIGADPHPDLLETPVAANILLFTAPLKAKHLPILVRALHEEELDERLRDNALLIGRIGSEAASAEPELRRLAKHSNDRVRGAAVWSLGRIGREVPEGLADRNPVVRELATATVRSVPRLVAILRSRFLEARVLAARRLGELGHTEALPELLEDPDPVLRIAAVRALGESTPPSAAEDPERDVRIAAASVLRGAALERLLEDPNWRVQLAAIRSLGRERRGAESIAHFLSHPNLALSWAAASALKGMDESAALAVADRIGAGNEAVWHYAPRIFGVLGERGAPAVKTLTPLLGHQNVNVRETAAKCLAAIGGPARGASRALTGALADRRLCVVANAALALGHIGVTEALIEGVRSERARVRAYSAFAIGWVLGERNGVDQVPFEPRLPVMDCGEPGVVPSVQDLEGLDQLPEQRRFRLCRLGLRSKDPEVAFPCVARLDYDQMNAWECERAVELVAPEGFRPGNTFDFEKFRAYIASSELPACLQYMLYPRTTQPDRQYIYANLHRSPRSENIPGICWIYREGDEIRQDGLSELTQPFDHSADHRAEVIRHYAGGEGDLWDVIESDRMLWTPMRWWLEKERIPEGKVPLLIDISQKNRRPDEHTWETAHCWAAIRLLGRATDGGSERYLRWAAEGEVEEVALAALARRRDPDAMARLLEDSAWDATSLGLLLEALPQVGNAVLRQRLSDPGGVAECVELLHDALHSGSYHYGIYFEPLVFLGIEASLPLESLGVEEIESIALQVPGCRTRRLAGAILNRVGAAQDRWVAAWKEGGVWPRGASDLGAFLLSAHRERYLALLRSWAKEPKLRGLAVTQLALIAEPQDEPFMGWLTEPQQGSRGLPDEISRWRTPGIEAALIERAREGDSEDVSDLLLYQRGFTFKGPRGQEELLSSGEKRVLKESALRGKGMEATGELLERRIDLFWDVCDRRKPEWMKGALRQRYEAREFGRLDEVLGQLATWPDARAREEYWSILKSGRYRWIVDWGEDYAVTLGHDFAALPHWTKELESNCCRISGRVEKIFEDLLGIEVLYNCASSGIGEPPSERVREWFELYGGDMEWSPLVDRFVARPE